MKKHCFFATSLKVFILLTALQGATALADFQDALPVTTIPPASSASAPSLKAPGQPPPVSVPPKPPKTEKKENPAPAEKSPPAPLSGQKDEGGEQAEDFSKHNSSAPVYFESRQAEGSRKQGTLTLSGQVVIVQDNVRLTSDKAQLFSAPQTLFLSGSTQIQKAVAEGHVHVYKKSSGTLQEMRASADRIEFFPTTRIMILSGQAKVWRGSEFLNADKMEINLNTGNMKFQSPQGTIDPRFEEKTFQQKQKPPARQKK